MHRPSTILALSIALSACSVGATPNGPNVPPETSQPNDTFFEPLALNNASKAPRTVEVSLTAAPASLSLVGGKQTQVYAYNGQVPGPTLELTEGDHVVVHFENKLAEPTTLHWHGMHVPSDQDGNPMDPVLPGARRDYVFDVPLGTAGTYWYHPHTANLTAEQAEHGLAGVVRVHPASDPLPSSFKDTIIVLSDNRLDSNGQIAPTTQADRMNGREGDLLLVNGRQLPTLTVRAGEVRRLRVLNASSARYYLLNVPGQALIQVATEAGFLEHPVERDQLLVAPGERLVFLLKATGQPGSSSVLQSLPYDRGAMTMPSSGMEGMRHTMALDGASSRPLIRIQTSLESPVQATPIPEHLRDVEALPISGAIQRSFVLSENMMALDFRINGQKYSPNRIDVRTKLGSTEIWSVRNDGDMDHPFHLHGTSFQVLDRNGVAEPFRAWKDTVNVRKGETVRLGVRFLDFRGPRMYHCHILEHEDLGMMGMVQVE